MVLTESAQWQLVDWRAEREKRFKRKPPGSDGENPDESYRDKSLLEWSWHRAQHALFVQESLVEQTRNALENVEKIKARVVDYMNKAQDRLIGARAEVEKMNAHAAIEPLARPSLLPAPILQPEV
jgi:hypothetical protein